MKKFKVEYLIRTEYGRYHNVICSPWHKVVIEAESEQEAKDKLIAKVVEPAGFYVHSQSVSIASIREI